MGMGMLMITLGEAFSCIWESYQKRVEFFSGRWSYITLRGRWYNTVLSVLAPTEDKIDDKNDSFYEELGHVFDQFLK
jgi:hypothetical protein